MARYRTPSADTFNGRIALAMRAEMARQGISQTELAERLGWTQRRISHRLTGNSPIGAGEVEQVAKALNVPLSRLLPVDEVLAP